GVPVETAHVRLNESDFPWNEYEAVLSPATQGEALFPNVFEGPFSVEAKDVFGRDGGRVPSVLPRGAGEGTSVEVEVRLNAIGTVKGRFLLPDGDPIPFGVVTLLSGGEVVGRATTEGSDDAGSFLFDYVPIGALRLEAQDPLTARHGFATGELGAQDEVLVLDVRAQGLGRVEGTVRANGLPQAAASVELVSGTFRAATSADDFGFYFIEGVPEGRVTAEASLGNGFLAGKAEAALVGDGTTLLLDVALRDSATVSGRVTRAGSGEAAPPSIVTLAGLSTTSDPLDGSFRFERVPAGSATLSAAVLGSIDRGRRSADLPAGGALDLEIRLNGVGALQVQAPGAGKLTLRGTGDFPYSLAFTLGGDGMLFLPEILAGPLTATFETVGAPKLFGTSSAVLLPDTTLSLPIAIEPTGTVRGIVRRADLAPAAGANVYFLLSGGRGVPSTQTEDDGTFEKEGIPVGSLDLRVFDPFTGGVGFRNDLTIAFEDEVLDGIVLDLDDSPVSVVAVDPENGAVDVPTNHVVRVTFSDPVAALNGALRIPSVFLSPALAPDGRSATLTGLLPDSRTLTVEVGTELVDIFGRRPVAPFTSVFRTVDLSPPRVISTSPADGAFEVPAEAVVSVAFDEPLSDTTNFSSLVSVLGPGGPVAGASQRVSATEARFVPDVPLPGNALYQVVVNGAVDEIGNTQTAAATVARFATHDTVAPLLNLVSPPAGSWISQPRPGIQVSVLDNASGIAPATAAMKLDGASVSAIVVGTSLVFSPGSDLPEGSHLIEATVADRAGNLGAFSGSFSVDRTPPSAAEITSPAAAATLVGIVRFRAASSDIPSGVARIDLRANGSNFTSLFAPDFEKDFDTAGLPEGDAILTARAVDLAGNAGPEGAPVQVAIDNRSVTVTFVAPAANLRVRDAVDVWVTVSEPVERVELEIGGVRAVDSAAPYQATLDLTGVAEGPQSIVATAFGLTDTGSASRVIVVDRTP
ncbi:MAG TPA: Ig-like domain-containing protein, partial [Vicinamibacteria bacterium]|nr:Ig-like domain-containing protein [Vicinamibacteria bacterium]